MRRSLPTLSLFTILISLSASPSFAGIVFEIETQDHNVSPPSLEHTTVYAEGRSLKMDSSKGPRSNFDTMIFQGDRREMVVVDHQRQSYMVIDKHFAAKMAGQLGQQLQQQSRPHVQVSNTGKPAKVYGYDCLLFVVTRDGRKVRDVWVTEWNNISGGRELAAPFDSMSEFMLELTSAFPGGANAPMQDNAFATIKQMGSFPVATREYRADGNVKSETALRSAQSRRINPADFQPPRGYRPKSMFGR